MDLPVDLERFAAISADLDAGYGVDEVITREGISFDAWSAAEQEWLTRIVAERAEERVDLTTRYNAAFGARRRTLGLRDGDLVVPALVLPGVALPGPGVTAPPAPRVAPPAVWAPAPGPAAAPLQRPSEPAPPPFRAEPSPWVSEAHRPPVQAPPPAPPPIPMDPTPAIAMGFSAPAQAPAAPSPWAVQRMAPSGLVAPVAIAVPDTVDSPDTIDSPDIGNVPGAIDLSSTMMIASPALAPASPVLPFARRSVNPVATAPRVVSAAQAKADESAVLLAPEAQMGPALPFRQPGTPFRPASVAPAAMPAPVVQEKGPALPVKDPLGTTMPVGLPPGGAPSAAGALPFRRAAPASGSPPAPRAPATPRASPTPGAQSAQAGGLPFQRAPAAAGNAATPRLTIEQFASLAAEMALSKGALPETQARYGLTEATYKVEAAVWQQRFAASPALHQRWVTLYQTYRDWLAKKPR